MKAVALNGGPRKAGNTRALIDVVINQMVIPGSCYWNLGIGLKEGDVQSDEEGIRTMQLLGQNMAWLMKRTQG